MTRVFRLTLRVLILGIGFGSILPARAQQQQPQGQPQQAQQAPSTSQNSSSTADAAVAAQRRADLIRKRAEWFQRQRAYPNQRIPAGALQKAIEQRNKMIQQQRSGLHLAAPGIISFPGDGVWHAIGPQPTDTANFPGLGNFGFPTASGRVTALAVDPSDTTGQTVYLGGAAGGVWKTTDGGAHWTPLTDNQPSLAVGSIAIDPNNHNTIYAGTGEENFNIDAYAGAGILKSTDGGNTWTQLGAAQFAGPQTSAGGAKVGAIAVQPGNSSIVLAAVTYVDGGAAGGIYRSTDAGAHWTQVSGGANSPVGAAGTAVVFEPTSVAGTTAIVYAAMGDAFGDAANGIYKSTDSGQTWTKLSGGLPTSNLGRIVLGYAPSTSGSGATLYAAIADSSSSSANLLGFFVTTNGGTGWTQKGATPKFCNAQCFFDMAVAVHPTNPNFVVVGGSAYTDNSTTLFKSTDGGSTWSTDSTTPATDFTLGSTSVRPHADTHALTFAANGATPRFYDGNDGGVWRTDDPTPGNPLWVDLNGTLALSQFYPGTMPSISDENYGFGGTQDNDIQVFSGTLDWAGAPACGDGGYTAIDPTFPTTIYAGCNSTAASKVMQSVFYGQFTPGPTPTPVPSFQPAETAITASGDTMGFIPPLVMGQFGNLQFGTCQIWQGSVNFSSGAVTWSAGGIDLTTGSPLGAPCGGPDYISAIDASQDSSSNVFAGTSNGKVWLAFFSSFTEIDNGLLPTRHVTAVRSKRSDSTHVYVTFSGFGTCPGCDGKGHVFKTTNANMGPSTTWTDISGNLPDVPVNDIIVDHSGSPTFDALYIATDVGVFSCPDPEAATPCTDWTVVGDGLPNSPVLSIAMRRNSRILRAGTHGRSMFDIQLRDEQPGPLPELSSLTPAAVFVGAPATTVTVTGLNFSPNTQVLVDGFIPTGLTVTFVNTTQLTVSVPANQLLFGNVYRIGLSDPLGADPNTLPFTVMNPIPTVTSIVASPATGIVGEPVKFTVTGTGFVPGTELTLNGNVVGFSGTVSNNGTQIVFNVSGSALTAPSPGLPVAVVNRLPGGGGPATPSTPFNFPINANGTAEISFGATPPEFCGFFTPSQDAGTTSAVLNCTLTNIGGATLNLNASSATISSTNASDFKLVTPTSGTPICGFITGGTGTAIATNGTCSFGMTFSPPLSAPAGGRFATLTVSDGDSGVDMEPQLFLNGTVNGPIPSFSVRGSSFSGFCSVVSCFPNPISFGTIPKGVASEADGTLFNGGSGSTALSVLSISILTSTNSADFKLGAPSAGNPTSPCNLSGGFSLASFSSCALGITFTPSQTAVETATLEITFSNPGIGKIDVPLSGSGVVPTIDSLSPDIVATGGPAFTLTVAGHNFVLGSVVNVNGNARLTTFVSATQLSASIPASDISTATSLAITVTNPSGGGTSEPKTLIVSQAISATNDNWSFADNTSTTPYVTTEDTTQATTNTGGNSDPTPACAPGTATLSGKAKSVWFKFVATANGIVVANTRYSSYPTILSVWTGTPGSFTAVGGVNGCASGNIPGTSPAQSFVSFGVSSGTTYYMMVSDATSGTATGGTLTLSVDFASAAPANDAFNNATVIAPPVAGAVYSNTVNTILATPNTNLMHDPTPPCAPAGAVIGGIENSVWYSFTPTSNVTVTADTLTSDYATILSVWTGSPGSFNSIQCNATAGSGATQVVQSQLTFNAASGTTYFIMISSVLGDGGTTNFHLSMSSTPTAPTITSANSVTFTVGVAGTFTVTASGTPAPTLSETGTLPSGVSFNAATGVLSGTPATGAQGTYPITFKAHNGVGSDATQSFTLTVNAAPVPPAITSANNVTFTVGVAGTFTVTAMGSPTPTLSESGALPSGVTFTPGTGVLAGTPGPGTAGTYNISFTAANGVGSNAVQSFTLTVNQVTAITSANSATFLVGTAGSFTVTATGSPTPTLSESGTLPAGVNFNASTGVLSGTPAAGSGGAYSIVFKAHNGAGADATQNFTLTVNQTAAITSASSVTFTVGAAGTFTVTATGFPVPTLSETGALPGGVTFNPATGVLGGTPVAGTAGTYPLTFTAHNSAGPDATQSFTLTVNQTAAITSANSTTFLVGTAGSFTVTATGSPTPTLSESGALPSGVTFAPGTGVLAGTPAAGTAGTYNITFTAHNGVGTDAVQNFTLTVSQAAAITSANSTTFLVGTAGSFTVTATGVPIPTLSESGTLPAGVTFNASTGVLAGTPAAGSGGTYTITFKAHNGAGGDATQTFTLTVNQTSAITSANGATFTVGTAGTFTVVATGSPAPTLSVTGSLPSGVSFTPATGVLAGTAAAGSGGTYNLTFTAHNGVGADAVQAFTLTVTQTAAITSPNSTTFTVGVAGTFSVTATGFPAPTLSETGTLPGGVTFNSATGVLSGTPAAGTAGTYNITFKAHNGVGSDATQSFTLTVSQVPVPPSFTSGNTAIFTIGSAGTFTVTANGSPTPTLSETGLLPSGVTFVDNGNGTGKLSGIPAAGTAGNYVIMLSAHNTSGPDASQTFTLTVDQTAAITSANSATFTVGAAGSFTVIATGSPAPTVSASGTLPSGVTFNASTGILSGTPTAGTGGTYNITFTAHNGAGPDATQNFTLTVNQSAAITSANSVTFTIGAAGTFTVAATGFPVPTLSESGALPTGVTFNASTGVLGGTPAAGTPGTYPITFTAHNGVGSDATQSFTLTVNQTAAITSANSTAFLVGTAGSFTVTATGSPTPTLSESGALPSGVTFNATTGVLGGTPAAGTGGAYNITFTAHNGVGSDATQNFTLTVNQTPAITSANSVTFTVGTAGTFTVTTTGFPVPTLSETGALPGGVTFNSATGVLSGTPTAGSGAVYSITFTAHNVAGADATQSFTLTVNQAAAITSANNFTFAVGTAGTFTVVATGFPAPTLGESGALPTGVTFTPATGVLAGTPAAGTAGTYNITFTAHNGVGSDATQSFTLTVSVPPAVTTNPVNQTVSAGSTATFTADASGTPTPTVQWQVSTDGGTTFTNVSGATSKTLSFTAAVTQNGNKYHAVFTNSVGTAITTAATLTVISPDVTIAKSHSGDFIVGANGGTYTIKVTNHGTGPTTGNITVTDTLPAGLAFVSSTGAGWACSASGQTVTCTYTGAPLAATGGSSTFTLTVSVAPNAITSSLAAGFVATNTATVSDPNDSKTTDKSASDPTNLDNAVPSLSSISPVLGAIAGATGPQTVTLTGSGFNASTMVSFGGNPPLAGTASPDGKTLTISVPPADLTSPGNVTVGVNNPANPTSHNGGGTNPAGQNQTFPVVGIQIQPHMNTPNPLPIVAGTPFQLQMDVPVTPTSAMLPVDVAITCSFPASETGATCMASPSTMLHDTAPTGVMITINAVPTNKTGGGTTPALGGRGPWTTVLLWSLAAALLSMLGMLRMVRQRVPQLGRASAYLTLLLLILATGALVGCTTNNTPSGPTPTPTGPSTITVTATPTGGTPVSSVVNINVTN
jgi:uncharacterized repeat protein (TIGR01451 family)